MTHQLRLTWLGPGQRGQHGIGADAVGVDASDPHVLQHLAGLVLDDRGGQVCLALAGQSQILQTDKLRKRSQHTPHMILDGGSLVCSEHLPIIMNIQQAKMWWRTFRSTLLLEIVHGM